MEYNVQRVCVCVRSLLSVVGRGSISLCQSPLHVTNNRIKLVGSQGYSDKHYSANLSLMRESAGFSPRQLADRKHNDFLEKPPQAKDSTT